MNLISFDVFLITIEWDSSSRVFSEFVLDFKFILLQDLKKCSESEKKRIKKRFKVNKMLESVSNLICNGATTRKMDITNHNQPYHQTRSKMKAKTYGSSYKCHQCRVPLLMVAFIVTIEILLFTNVSHCANAKSYVLHWNTTNPLWVMNKSRENYTDHVVWSRKLWFNQGSDERKSNSNVPEVVDNLVIEKLGPENLVIEFVIN